MIMLDIFIVTFVAIFFGFKIADSFLKYGKEEEEKKLNEEKDTYQREFISEEIKQLDNRISLIPNIRRIIFLVYFGTVIIWAAFSAIFVTTEQQTGVINTLGSVTKIETSGVHFKIPFISEKHILDSTIKGMPIGYVEEKTEDEKKAKGYVDPVMITKDFNFIDIDFYAEYRIADPIEYLYGSKDPENIFKNIVQAAIRNTVGQYLVDGVMTTERGQIETDIYEIVSRELGEHHTGLTITSITVQDAEPPTKEVKKAFTDVEQARQNAETKKNEAQEYENEKIPDAEASAEGIKASAEAKKTERVNLAKEEVSKFNSIFKEYSENPETVKSKLYFDTIKDIFPKMDIIIGGDKTIIVRGNSLTPETSETNKNSEKK